MIKRILYVTATELESAALRNIRLNISGENCFSTGKYEISLLVAGIGCVSNAWHIMNWFHENGKPDIAINGGIAGSFREDIKPGDVVMPVTEVFGDSGIENRGEFSTLFEEGFVNTEEFPYASGKLNAGLNFEDIVDAGIRRVDAVTMGTSTGSDATRERLLKKFNPDIETMEGASFFYICLRERVPFIALRAISNMVGNRNRKAWKIERALENLSNTLNSTFLKL